MRLVATTATKRTTTRALLLTLMNIYRAPVSPCTTVRPTIHCAAEPAASALQTTPSSGVVHNTKRSLAMLSRLALRSGATLASRLACPSGPTGARAQPLRLRDARTLSPLLKAPERARGLARRAAVDTNSADGSGQKKVLNTRAVARLAFWLLSRKLSSISLHGCSADALADKPARVH